MILYNYIYEFVLSLREKKLMLLFIVKRSNMMKLNNKKANKNTKTWQFLGQTKVDT